MIFTLKMILTCTFSLDHCRGCFGVWLDFSWKMKSCSFQNFYFHSRGLALALLTQRFALNWLEYCCFEVRVGSPSDRLKSKVTFFPPTWVLCWVIHPQELKSWLVLTWGKTSLGLLPSPPFMGFTRRTLSSYLFFTQNLNIRLLLKHDPVGSSTNFCHSHSLK